MPCVECEGCKSPACPTENQCLRFGNVDRFGHSCEHGHLTSTSLPLALVRICTQIGHVGIARQDGHRYGTPMPPCLRKSEVHGFWKTSPSAVNHRYVGVSKKCDIAGSHVLPQPRRTNAPLGVRFFVVVSGGIRAFPTPRSTRQGPQQLKPPIHRPRSGCARSAEASVYEGRRLITQKFGARVPFFRADSAHEADFGGPDPIRRIGPQDLQK